MEHSDKQIKKLIAVIFILLSVFITVKTLHTADISCQINTVSQEENKKVSINTASEQELASQLKGIGDVLASRIVEYRNIHGSFKTKDELINIDGLGRKIFESIRDDIIL